MSANNDNAMTRFLFAILQQKCLKDIDWNKVAHDPILTQEITNGHAARMRYSRFRASLLGLEPQRRNRTNKNKVTKSKKEPKGKKGKAETIKPDPGAKTEETKQEDSKAPPSKIKNESQIKMEPQQGLGESRLTPAELPLPDARVAFHNRLLTPCSDIDLFAPTHAFTNSPTGDMLHHDPFTYRGHAAAAAAATATHCGHDQPSWQPSPSYSPFPMPSYELDGYSPQPVFCDHKQVLHAEEFGIAPSAMMAPPPDHGQTPVKHEEWDHPRFG